MKRRRYGVPPVRALRRVETPPGVHAQHDWFEVRTRLRAGWCGGPGWERFHHPHRR